MNENEILSLSPLEFRLEIGKHISNLRFDLLKRLYHGESIIEGYEHGKVEVHMHGFAGALGAKIEFDKKSGMGTVGRFCACFSCRPGDFGFIAHNDEVTVLVGIGQKLETLRPLRSVVRLQPLNGCRMHIADFGKESLSLSLEARWAILDWELRALLLDSGIKNCEAVDEIIQTGPTVQNDLANQYRETEGDFQIRLPDLKVYSSSVRVFLISRPDGFELVVHEGCVDGFQLSKAFARPSKPDIGFIKRMHDLYSQREQAVGA